MSATTTTQFDLAAFTRAIEERDAPTQRVATQREARRGAREHVFDTAREGNGLPAHPPRVAVSRDRRRGGSRLPPRTPHDWYSGRGVTRKVGVLTVSREVECPRQVAFRREARDHAVPGAAGAAESVQQDETLRHLAIL